jgi:phosphoribosylformylglycinamidine cyclo-ligase
MAHITGGGLTGNLPRILPQQCQAAVKYKSWPIQPIFQIIQQAGNIEQQEMLRVFNMGIGLVLIVPPAEVNTIQSMAKEFSEPGYLIGEIRKRAKGSSSVCFVE